MSIRIPVCVAFAAMLSGCGGFGKSDRPDQSDYAGR